MELSIPEEVIISKIYSMRGEKVMIDRDLAILYGVETKYLKRQVRRNISRFPQDFMFQLNKSEFSEWRSQIVSSNSKDKMGLRHAPFAFTEQGVAQLSSVLNSERAINVNIQIIRLFISMRKILLSNLKLINELKTLEDEIKNHDDKIKLIFAYLEKLEQERQKDIYFSKRAKIGFKQKEDSSPDTK
jgi:hypothetical protein